jgi:hypothetical protein
MKTILQQQQELCKRYGQAWVASPDHLKVGIARNALTSMQPLNGLRHPVQGDTTGWYIWAGEQYSEAADFFEPMHVAHLLEKCPAALKYLGLPPGWRFLAAGDYEDVWEDAKLLNV